MTHYKAFFLIPVLLLAAGAACAETRTYKLRAGDHDRVELVVEKTGLLSGKRHLFTFSQYGGAVRFDRERPETSTVAFFLQAGTIVCRDTWLGVKDLRKVQEYAVKDMLAANRYPQISFRSSGIKKIDPSHYEVEGVLTIRDVSKPVVIVASLTVGAGESISIEGGARVHLTDFGLKPPTAALGTIGTKSEMVFRFVLQATASTGSLRVGE